MEGGPQESPKKKAAARKTKDVKYRKAPQAPKRFKSAYMFFSTAKHKEIREQLADGGPSVKTTEVAKMVSSAWKTLSDEDRETWNEMARQDKERYERERSMYTGPWRVAAADKNFKDPNAPRRPMSAFLAFSNSKRRQVREQFPGKDNTEVSRYLSQQWKELSEEERKPFLDEERRLREEYKVAMAQWRADEQKVLEEMRQQQRRVDILTTRQQQEHEAAAMASRHQTRTTRQDVDATGEQAYGHYATAAAAGGQVVLDPSYYSAGAATSAFLGGPLQQSQYHPWHQQQLLASDPYGSSASALHQASSYQPYLYQQHQLAPAQTWLRQTDAYGDERSAARMPSSSARNESGAIEGAETEYPNADGYKATASAADPSQGGGKSHYRADR